MTLSPDRHAGRFGTQYLLVKDDLTHYRPDFGGECHALATSARVEIRTGDAIGRLCPGGSEVETRRGRR